MGDRITNAVLAEKIDSLHEVIKEDIKPAVQANTEFRLKIKGMIALISGFAATLGAGLAVAIEKLIGK